MSMLSKYMIDDTNGYMTMGKFRELTKDIPDDAILQGLEVDISTIPELLLNKAKGYDITDIIKCFDICQIIYFEDTKLLITSTFNNDISSHLSSKLKHDYLYKKTEEE